MALQIEGGTSGVKADVSTQKELFIKPTTTLENVGYIGDATVDDEGSFTGTKRVTNVESDSDFRKRVAVDALEFRHTFDGTTLDSGVWSSTVVTMTTSVAGGYLNLNASAITTLNTSARITSYRTFSFSQAFSTYLDIPLQLAAASAGIANTTWEGGFFLATGSTAPTDGVFVRMDAAGDFKLVSSYAGSETESDVISQATLLEDGFPILSVNRDRQFVLEVMSHEVKLWADDYLVAKLVQPAGVPAFAASQSLPICFRIYNGGSAPASATQLKIGTVTVSRGGQVNAPTFIEAAALSGHGAERTQSGNASPGQNANWTNNAAPSAATLSNTTPSYSTKGGQFVFAAPAGSENDYALFGYLVPAAAAGSMNRNLLVRKIRISSVNVGAAVATTATVIAWGVGVGATAASLATAEAAAARSARREAIGMQSWVVGAAIGAQAQEIELDCSNSPLLVEPGTYLHIICRVVVGTATPSQQIRGVVSVVGQFV